MSLSRHLPDGSCWPAPGAAMDDLEYRLRHDHRDTAASDRMAAASAVAAYRALIQTDSRRRAEVVRALKVLP